MALFFGQTQVQPNAILTPTITFQAINYAPTIEQEQLPLLLILLNTTTDMVNWMFFTPPPKTNQVIEEIIPYTAPTTPDRYSFYVYDATGTNVPEEIQVEEFTKFHTSAQFGKRIFSISFYVQAATLSSIADISRIIASDLTLAQIDQLCESDPQLKRQICDSLEFYKELARVRLTNNESQIAVMDKNEIRQVVQYYEDMTRKFSGNTIATKDIKQELTNLLRYPIAFEELWNKLTRLTRTLFILNASDQADKFYLYNLLSNDDKVTFLMGAPNSIRTSLALDSLPTESIKTLVNRLLRRRALAEHENLIVSALSRLGELDQQQYRPLLDRYLARIDAGM
jgi:hypothetical protein